MMSYAFQFRQLNSVEEASRSINNAAINLRASGDINFMDSQEFWNEADRSLRRNVSLVVIKNSEPYYQSRKLPNDIDLTLFPKFGELNAIPTSIFSTSLRRQSKDKLIMLLKKVMKFQYLFFLVLRLNRVKCSL